MREGHQTAPRRRLLLLGLAALIYALAFLQRPGETVAETRIELSADPGLFLERVAQVWSATTDFGHVQSGNFGGYLVPMGPYFAGGDALGVPMWILQRFWLGSLLLIAAWGMVRLMDALLGRRSVAGQLGAALAYLLNPYVVLYASRGTVTLMTYASLPWLMLAIHGGLRERRGWRWPAVMGLILALSPGGVNAAVIGFALVGPLALLLYDVALGSIDRRDAWSFAWRASVLGILGSLWWTVPLLLQAQYGENFLLFTEHARTIWGTTSLSELLRLLGFWTLYTGVGFGGAEPFMSVAHTYLFNPLVIVATFALPLFAFATLRLTRGWRYAPFFVLLAVVALLLMFAGYPAGTRLRAVLVDVYDTLVSLQFMRTTYKAAPLLALSLACLSGAGVAALAARRVPRWALAALALIPAVAAAPLFEGRAIDERQVYGSVPPAWPTALRDADRDQPPATRTMVLPGELFGWYRWGGTGDSIAPTISRRPVAIREIVPYADYRSSQLQIAVDDLIQQGRLVPGQLAPLLRLLDVGQVLVATDGNPSRNGALDPVRVEGAIAGQRGLTPPQQEYGRERSFEPPPGRSGSSMRLPAIARRAVTGVEGPGGVHVKPAGGVTVLEGDAEGVPQLAALGLLEPRRALLYAGDVDAERRSALVGTGARLVLTDSARRRTFTAPRVRANRGPTLGPEDPVSGDSPIFDPFLGRGNAGRTVALYSGLRRIHSPAQPGFEQFPQYRPYAAMDGRPDTSWLADQYLPSGKWWLQVDLDRPRTVGSLGIVPHATRVGRTTAVWLSLNGGEARRVELENGRNRVRVGEDAVTSLRLRIAKIAGDEDRRGAGGIAELEVPGLRVRERLRLPTALADSLRGADLSRNEIEVALSRTTADFPYRAGANVGEPEDRSLVAMVDAEDGLERELSLPAVRTFALSGWASVGPRAADDAIDRLAGLSPGWRFTSSGRFEGVPGRRASSAFDGDRGTAWVGDLGGARRPFVAWRSPVPVGFRRLRLAPGPAAYAFPSRLRLAAPGQPPVTVAVSPSGEVVLPRPIRTKTLRAEVVAVHPRRGAAAGRRLRAVALAEVTAPGLRPPAPRRGGRFATACGELRASPAGGRPALMRVSGSVGVLYAGGALRLRGCGPRSRLTLPAGGSRLSVPPGAVMRPDHLRLGSPAPRPLAVPPVTGRVVSVKEGGPPGAPGEARLAVDAASWLVLAQSYNAGWRAWCRDASGRELSLGAPLAIDGYANGWLVRPGCQAARFAFTPQRTAVIAYAISAVASLGMLALVVLGTLRRRRRRGAAAASRSDGAASPPDQGPIPALPPDLLLRPGWLATFAISGAVALLSAGLFALRMGVVMGALTFLLLRVGVNVGRLIALAALLTALLPLHYLLFPSEDKGGFSFEYANDQINAHWVAVVVVCCLAAGGGLAAWRMRRAETPGEAGAIIRAREAPPRPQRPPEAARQSGR
jgi:arabinofuranan 3-O-arabinosyltransferase